MVVTYPVRFRIDEQILSEYFPEKVESLCVEAKTEDCFMDILRKIFDAEKTTEIISAILGLVTQIDRKEV